MATVMAMATGTKIARRKRNNRQSRILQIALFNEYGVDKFLMEHYELLHTQGTGYVLDEIDLFLKARKNEIVSYNI